MVKKLVDQEIPEFLASLPTLTRIDTWIPADLLELIELHCKEHHTTQGHVISNALREYLAKPDFNQ